MSSADTFPFPYPAWVNWVAQDADGGWWGYSVESLRNDTGWYENEVGESVRLGYAEPASWEVSLRSVRFADARLRGNLTASRYSVLA